MMNLDVKFDIVVKDVEELQDSAMDPFELACGNAYRKANTAVEDLDESAIVIAADTIVYLHQILGKPENKEDAYKMLKSLSGKEHQVVTSVAILETPSKKKNIFAVSTKVFFKHLTDDEINNYISSGEPMDKAGAYGIQGKGALFVEKIEGDYFNVVGLPLFKIEDVLKREFNTSLLK